MKTKRVLAVLTASMMAISMLGCGNTAESESAGADSTVQESTAATQTTTEDDTTISYANCKLGESYTDVTATIKVLTDRTDLLEEDAPIPYSKYVDAFNKIYPNITVEVEGITDYANETLLRLQGGDWGDVMLIPALDKADYSTYFLSYGSVDEVSKEVNFLTNSNYGGQVYGIPSSASINGGIVYNKAVFEKAGITTLPKTPDEFITALKTIKEKTDAIPLYTNYAAGWALGGQWDPAISGSATGDTLFMNQKFLHASEPFTDPGDGTGAYNVYKVLYDAVNQKLTEDDYATTDWEGSKGMINKGEIACMVLGSWAVPQMQQAGENGADIAYMPFPITVDGKQCASVGPGYGFGINASATDDNKKAAMAFVKFMTEQSGFSYDGGGLPIAAADTNKPDFYAAFDGVEMVPDTPAIEGEEDLLNVLNTDSDLNFNQGGDQKLMSIIEHASMGDESFDDIMKEWNTAWTKAQTDNGVTVE